MTTRPYSELLAQVEALAGASLATQEQARVKIFANRRARKAFRECDYWPRFFRVGDVCYFYTITLKLKNMKKVSGLIKSKPEAILIAGFLLTVVVLSVYNSIVYGVNDSPW